MPGWSISVPDAALPVEAAQTLIDSMSIMRKMSSGSGIATDARLRAALERETAWFGAQRIDAGDRLPRGWLDRSRAQLAASAGDAMDSACAAPSIAHRTPCGAACRRKAGSQGGTLLVKRSAHCAAWGIAASTR